MRHPWILIAPLLLAAPHTAGATVATAPTPEAPPTEALETPVPADDPPDAAYEAPGPRLASLVSWDGDLEAFTPPLRAIGDDPPSDERTPRPTPEEWKAADEVALARAHQSCTARRVREWLRIGCEVLSSLAAMDSARRAARGGVVRGARRLVRRAGRDLPREARRPAGAPDRARGLGVQVLDRLRHGVHDLGGLARRRQGADDRGGLSRPNAIRTATAKERVPGRRTRGVSACKGLYTAWLRGTRSLAVAVRCQLSIITRPSSRRGRAGTRTRPPRSPPTAPG